MVFQWTTFTLLKRDKIEWFYLLVWQVRSILKILSKTVFFYNHVKATIKEVCYLWKLKKETGDTGFSFVFLFKPIFFFFCKTIMRKSVFQFFHSLCLVELICYSLCPQTLTNYYKLEKYFYFRAASTFQIKH